MPKTQTIENPAAKLTFVPDAALLPLAIARETALQKPTDDESEQALADRILDAAIAKEKQSLNDLLNAIAAHPDFRRLESTWSSLERFAMDPNTSGVDIRVINQPFHAIKADLEDAGANKQSSQLFNTVVRQGYLTPGSQPTTALNIADSCGLSDLPTLLDIGGIAEDGHFRVFTQAKPELLVPGSTNFSDMSPDPTVIKEDAASDDRLSELRAFRQDSRARRIVMAGPCYLPRKQFHPVTNPAKGVASFEEHFTNDSAPWASVSYIALHRIADSLTRYKIASQIVGEYSGGKHPVPTVIDEYGRQQQILQIAVCDQFEKALSDVRFLVAEPYLKQGFVVLFCAVNMFDAPADSLDGDVSYGMSNDQIAHDLKRLTRAALGMKLTTQKASDLIRSYLCAKYCSASSIAVASFEELARRPFKDVAVIVTEPLPGVFDAEVELFPHLNAKQFHVTTKLKVSSV